MFEILIRIESLCLESPPAVLLGCGLLVLILGVLLWLAGSHFSAVILGLLGAVVGTVCGLLVSQWLNTPALISMLIGALVFTLATVLLRNVLIILLATLIFSLAGATVYSSLILNETSPEPSTSSSSFVQPFSRMNTPTRLAYTNQITKQGENFFERLRLLVKDTLQTVSPYKWKILLTALLGGIVGLILIWSLKKLILALCYSGVGTLLFLIGLEVILLGMNVHFISWFQEQRAAFTMIYLVLVGIGVIFQLMPTRSSKKISGKSIQNPE